MKTRVVSFLVSGRGSNFKAVAENIQNGKIHARIGCVISNKPGVPALDVAREMGIPVYVIESSKYLTRRGHEKAIIRVLKTHETDLVIAAGYMRILTPYIIREFRNRIMNIHPALLPAFPGMRAQKQAIDYGAKVSGCTVHFVDEGTDTGPIIIQKTVEIAENDTSALLSKKILEKEYEALTLAVSLFCENRLDVIGRKVLIK
jgi:phosphoribosylglycinamide formyltransferase 1